MYNDLGRTGYIIAYGSTAAGVGLSQNSFNIVSGATSNGMLFNDRSSNWFKWSNSAGSLDSDVDMKLTSTGLLLGTGIGATAVGAKLHVIGSTLLDGNLGVFGATPIAQPTTAHAAATVLGGVGASVLDDDQFDGYTVAQVVRALKDLGILA